MKKFLIYSGREIISNIDIFHKATNEELIKLRDELKAILDLIGLRERLENVGYPKIEFLKQGDYWHCYINPNIIPAIIHDINFIVGTRNFQKVQEQRKKKSKITRVQEIPEKINPQEDSWPW